MPLLTTSNIEELFQAANLSWAVEKSQDKNFHQIKIDLRRTFFLGTEIQATHHLNFWQTQSQPEYYLQGNMSAGNLYMILGTQYPFWKKNEELEAWQAQYVCLSFAFVNNKNELCGLTILFRRDEPTQWLIGLVQNTNVLPRDRKVLLLSSFDLKPYMTTGEVHSEQVSPAEFIQKIDNPSIESLLTKVIANEGKTLDIKSIRMQQLFRTLSTDGVDKVINDFVSLDQFTSDLLFAENKALDLLAEHDIKLSTALLQDCVFKTDGLRKVLENIKLSNNLKQDKQLVRLIVIFYEEKILDLCTQILADTEVLKQVGKLINDPTNKNLVINLIKAKYNFNLFRIITSNEAYYSNISFLEDYGLTEKELNQLFIRPKKHEELLFIYSLEEKFKSICRVFWIKGDLTLEEYKKLVQIITNEPYLINLLEDLDKTKQYSIDELKQFAFDPLKRQVKIIVYQFATVFNRYQINQNSLKVLSEFVSEIELKSLVSSLTVLSTLELEMPQEKYLLTLQNNDQGKLIRIFIPQFAQFNDKEMCKNLIELFYMGITKGAQSQSSLIKALEGNPVLQANAQKLYERFLCTQQIQALAFNDQVMAFVASDSPQALRFQRIVMQVEAECERMHERIRASTALNRLEVIKQWQNAYGEYRKTVYGIAYDTLTAPDANAVDLKKVTIQIQQAEARILVIIDPKIQSWLYKALVVIANIVITALTLGIANFYNEKRTGNYWFFTRTKSGDELRALDKEVFNLLQTPIV